MKIRDRVAEFKRVKGSEILPHPQNWKTHPQKQQNALRGVLAEVGIAGALVAWKSPNGLQLLDGHLRTDVSPDTEWPVLVLDVDESEARKLLVSMDPLAELAEMDVGKLEELLKEVTTESEGFQDLLDGLADEAGLIQEDNEVEEDGGGDIDRAEELLEQWGVETGDLWLIRGESGIEHRLLCGDSTNGESAEVLFSGARAMLLFTSPPYKQQRNYKNKIDDWDALMQGVFGVASEHMEADGQIIVNLGLVHENGEWMPYWDGWIEWMREQGWRRFGWYVWDQGSGLPGDWNGRLAPSHEFVWHFNRSSVRPEKTVKTKQDSQKRKGKAIPIGFRKQGGSVPATSPDKIGQPFKILDSVIRVSRSPIDGRIHPATFPVKLAGELLSAWPGLCFEPFCGSGTTLVAANQLNRRCFAVEISPAYCAVTLDRMEKQGCTCEKSK